MKKTIVALSLLAMLSCTTKADEPDWKSTIADMQAPKKIEQIVEGGPTEHVHAWGMLGSGYGVQGSRFWFPIESADKESYISCDVYKDVVGDSLYKEYLSRIDDRLGKMCVMSVEGSYDGEKLTVRRLETHP